MGAAQSDNSVFSMTPIFSSRYNSFPLGDEGRMAPIEACSSEVVLWGLHGFLLHILSNPIHLQTS